MATKKEKKRAISWEKAFERDHRRKSRKKKLNARQEVTTCKSLII